MSLADYACADEPAHVFAYHADALAFLRSLPCAPTNSRKGPPHD